MKVEYYNSFQTFTDYFNNLVDVNNCISVTVINQSNFGELYVGGYAFILYPQSSFTFIGNELEKYKGKLTLKMDQDNINPYYIVIKKLQINETTI